MLRLCLLSAIGLLGFLAFKLRPKHKLPTIHAPAITTITDMPSASTSSPPPFLKLTYDVFLSFRGEDTRRSFTDHLYDALKRKGICTFRDGEQLEKGKPIAPELSKAIEESRFAIVVLSRNYANSSWCLDEIANILDSMEKKKVLPVFYDVNPSDIRKQTGDNFENAFAKHEQAFKDEPGKVKRWRSALSQVANIAGWHLKDRPESEVIQEIVETISSELIQTGSILEDDLVGMDSHLKTMCRYLDTECPDVRVIGISGMRGIGKTTIAEVVFEREKAKFEGYCFLQDVREVAEKQGVVHLQNQLLSSLLKIDEDVQNIQMGKRIIKDRLCSKRVLIVLDDVNSPCQLEALCNRKWFGPGSRIIITSTDKQLLKGVGAFEVYEVNTLTEDEALQLFRMNAFKDGNKRDGEEILRLSKEFLNYANGLPLAIKVLGGFINGRSVESWSSELDRLKNYPVQEINKLFKVSFDGLRQPEQEIFLDIACFFKGDDRDRVIEVLKGRYHDHCPSTDIEGLIEKSMITLLGNKLWMHDYMQLLGRDIVHKECPQKPEKRSRLWSPKDIIYVLGRSKATNAIESILLQSPTQDHLFNDGAVPSIFLQSATQDDGVRSINNSAIPNISLGGPTKDDVVHSINDSFSKMDKLRLLKISNVKFSGNIQYFSTELQFLQWHDCPLDSFPSNFQPDNLVELHLHSSRIEHLWTGKQGWRMLRHIDMTGSQYLISTPDFTEVRSLETLVLQGCTSLVEVHPSLGFLKKLTYLNMRSCESVESIPPFTGLEALKTLNLSLCSRLKKFQEIEGNMECLLELHLDGTSIEELSWFLVGIKNLKSLTCRGCKGAPRSLLSPASLLSLTSLIDLDLSYCNLTDGDIPDVLSSLISLRELDLSGNSFFILPESFSQLSKLKTLYLRNCRQLKLVPKKLPLSLEYVHAQDCISLIDYPNQIKVLNSVESGKTTINSLVSSRTWSLYDGVKADVSLSLEYVHAQDCISLIDYPNQIKLLTSVESGVTTVNALSDSSAIEDTEGFTMCFVNGEEPELLLIRNMHTEEEPVVRLSLSHPVYQRAIQSNSALQSLTNSFYGIEANNKIPVWFDNTSSSNSISTPIGDKKWKGVATFVVFSVINPTADVEFSNYWYGITLETDAVSLKPFLFDRKVYEGVRPSSDLCLTHYEPSSSFPKLELNASTVVRARFETNNPFVVVQKCGIRLAYGKDALWCFIEGKGVYFPCENEAVLQSGWLSRGDKCLNWEKFTPPSEEDYSNNVVRNNMESVLQRILEALNQLHALYHAILVYKFNLSGSPAWFHNVVGAMPDRDSIGEGTDAMFRPSSLIEIPQNLHKSKKWMGFAIQASIAGEGEKDKYCVHLKLGMGAESHTVAHQHIRLSHDDQLLVFYIPRANLPTTLFAETSTTKMLFVSFVIDSPIKLRTVGVRVVYQEDIQGFVDAISRCIQKEDSLKIYDKFMVEEWIKLIQLHGGHLEGMSNPKERNSITRREKDFEFHSQKYRNWDWSAPSHFGCKFYGAEIFKWKWFMHIKQGHSAEIPLPPNLWDDDNWLGIAICAFSRLCPMSLGGAVYNSEYNLVTCGMDCDGHVHHMPIPFTEFDASGFARDVTLFIYKPRSDECWRKRKPARATCSWSSQYLAVQSCAVGLVYNKDVEHLVRTLTSCELP